MIDGVRGLSVLAVVVGHLLLNRILLDQSTLDAYEAGVRTAYTYSYVFARIMCGAVSVFGVKLFFIISGYLITSLLVAEEARSGRVSLAAFYTRRTFRILPAYGAFLLATWLLGTAGLFKVGATDMFYAVSFQCNLFTEPCLWWTSHSWSLAVEEQFYLVWPLLFCLLAVAQRRQVAVGLLIGVSLGSVVIPQLKHFAPICIGMLCGCDPRVAAWFKKHSAGWIAVVSIPILLAPFLLKRAPELKACLELMAPLALAFVFFATINGRGPLAPIARLDVIRRIGLVSYSLYLWQQLFTGRPELYLAPSLLDYWGLMVPIALASYVLIEQNGVTIGRALSQRIVDRTRLATVTANAAIQPTPA